MITARNSAPASPRALQRPVWGPSQSSLQTASRSPGFLVLTALAVYLIFRFSGFQDVVAQKLRVNTHYHYICVPILLLASVLGGRIVPVLRSSLGIWMIAFTFWIGACIPTSTWRRGSFQVFKDYLLNDFTIFVILGCVVCVLSAQKLAVYAMAVGMPLFVSILVLTSSVSTYGERTMMDYGTYGNPNNIASHLLFLGAFVVCAMLLGKPFGLRRAAGLVTLLAGSVYFFRSGSRGGLLALIVTLAVVLLALPLQKKAVAVLLLIVAVPGSVLLLPTNTLLRYRSIFSGTSGLELTAADARMLEAAVGSSVLREQLFRESVETSFRNPIFGVGPGEYDNYEAGEAKAAGRRANWLVTHNAYTQVSSEMGLVGFFFYMGLLLTTGLNLRSIRKRLRGVPHMQPAYLIASCLLLAWISYCVFSVFDYIAYYQYVPVLAGLTVGLKSAVEVELTNAEAPVAPAI